MVQVSFESPEETVRRLRRVIAESDFRVCEGTYVFEEFPLSELETWVKPEALALIRNDEVWSQLIPSDGDCREEFCIFSFHFDGWSDNSGFIGWLASHLKARLGTGVFVICGHNTARGGIFDYWGCPTSLAAQTIEEIRLLRMTSHSEESQ